MVAIFVSGSGQNEHSLGRTFHICFLLSFTLKKSSPLKPLGQMNRNLVGSFLGKSSINIAHLVPIRLQTWPPQTILVSDWLISKKSSPLKPLCQMNRKVSEEKTFKNRPIRNKNCLWWPCLLMDRDKISNL
jgi:hypothetical protein